MPLDHPGNKKPRRCLFLRGLWSFLDCFGKFGGGQGGIRTHGTLARTPDFESGTFDHSATCPRLRLRAGLPRGPRCLNRARNSKIEKCSRIRGLVHPAALPAPSPQSTLDRPAYSVCRIVGARHTRLFLSHLVTLTGANRCKTIQEHP